MALGMYDGSQAEWEARACWEAPSRGLPQEAPLQMFAVSQPGTQQESPDMQNDIETNMQGSGDSGLKADGSTSPADESEQGLQRVSKKAAAAAALQKALSNIQYIATGSQKARAAAAEASAAAEATATAHTSSCTLQPGTEHSRDAPQMATDDTRSTAYWDTSSTHQQTANAGNVWSSAAAAGTGQGWPLSADTRSLLAESSNSSDLSLDATSGHADMSTLARAVQLVSAQHNANSTEAESNSLSNAPSTVQPARPGLGENIAVAELPLALTAATSPHMSGDAMTIALSEFQPQAVLLSQPSASVQLPVAVPGCGYHEQGNTELSPAQLWPPLHLSHELPISPTVLPPAASSSGCTFSHASEHLATISLSASAGVLANRQALTSHAPEQLDTGSLPTSAEMLADSLAMPSLGLPLDAGPLQGWLHSGIQPSWNAALQPSQSFLMRPTALQVLPAPSQSATEPVEPPTDAPLLQLLTSLSAEAHLPVFQLSSGLPGKVPKPHADTLSRQDATLDNGNMFAQDSPMKESLQQLEGTASQPDMDSSLAEPAQGTDGMTSRRSTSQVSRWQLVQRCQCSFTALGAAITLCDLCSL